ncbi:MAG: serine/threonine-protein kinase, partial [Planctomycetota bacterium]
MAGEGLPDVDDPEGGTDATRPLSTQATSAEASPSIPGRIGHYRIKRVIGSGGMGTVYEAMQEHPRRAVALKVMKPGISSRSALRRFEYESQILARLRHPNIAQVYEAGTHDEVGGTVPYFVLEYIPNARSITEYARAKSLSTRRRLELFTKVCDAIQHGHRKGVIHRDLKPGNILVDSNGEPKVIDFGVARSTDSDLAITTLQTHVGQLIGTLQYMSPEQLEADPHAIDGRADVYSLGVVLYELLSDKL